MTIIGIPDKLRKTSITGSSTSSSLSVWDYVIHEHKADKAGLHFDLRLSPPGKAVAYSWALPKAKLPEPGERVLAVRQPDHTRDYMSWSGEIESGYGKGKVTIADSGQVGIVEHSDSKIKFIIEGSRYNLIHTGGDNWLLLNYTPTRSKLNIPDYKVKYKSVTSGTGGGTIDDDSVVLSPKYDGAHALFVLGKKNRGIDVFSYRPSKKTKTELIDHTFKTDLFKVKSGLSDTVLRGELFGRDSSGKVIPSNRTGGILNSGVLKSRETQTREGKLDHVIFDIVKFKGKYVEDLPFSEKLKLMQSVINTTPGLKLAPMAYDSKSKRALMNSVVSGKYTETDEGVIAFSDKFKTPQKLKLVNDFDVYVVDIFEGTGKYTNSAGGFIYSFRRGGPPIGRVGTGFSDSLRKDMWVNKDNYIGQVAKVTSGTGTGAGTSALRAPAFKEFRYELY